ncbi:hypothetical protein ACVGX7_06170, partial [Enterobacter hormaechei]
MLLLPGGAGGDTPHPLGGRNRAEKKQPPPPKTTKKKKTKLSFFNKKTAWRTMYNKKNKKN